MSLPEAERGGAQTAPQKHAAMTLIPTQCQQVPERMRSVIHPLACRPSRRLPDPPSARLPASPTKELNCLNSFLDFPWFYH